MKDSVTPRADRRPALLRLVCAAQLFTILLAPAWAQHSPGHGGNPGPHGGAPGWHGGASGWHGGHGPGPAWHGDIRHFNDHDRHVWSGGHWYHGPHSGHDGWWWVVGGTWYPYGVPVYPYPNPYIPPLLAPSPPPGVAAVPQFWYFCPGTGAYYPYIASCPGGWVQVPAEVR
ncbi:hypothetical protein NX773_11460 [Massilia solisilvae]|uniref:Uncharacterized protein n=1 Tax=Massilia solisilvae TaxID=1811225 RepID=A0ABT2BJU6_9BURK|nr:hypothetical protein [Massilia solisilvae]MCS0608783.1 hypothetical protein [Massilia solisilvae]